MRATWQPKCESAFLLDQHPHRLTRLTRQKRWPCLASPLTSTLGQVAASVVPMSMPSSKHFACRKACPARAFLFLRILRTLLGQPTVKWLKPRPLLHTCCTDNNHVQPRFPAKLSARDDVSSPVVALKLSIRFSSCSCSSDALTKNDESGTPSNDASAWGPTRASASCLRSHSCLALKALFAQPLLSMLPGHLAVAVPGPEAVDEASAAPLDHPHVPAPIAPFPFTLHSFSQLLQRSCSIKALNISCVHIWNNSKRCRRVLQLYWQASVCWPAQRSCMSAMAAKDFSPWDNDTHSILTLRLVRVSTKSLIVTAFHLFAVQLRALSNSFTLSS